MLYLLATTASKAGTRVLRRGHVLLVTALGIATVVPLRSSVMHGQKPLLHLEDLGMHTRYREL